jgi:eukaryotic-like serine/threonine-protein kinase
MPSDNEPTLTHSADGSEAAWNAGLAAAFGASETQSYTAPANLEPGALIAGKYRLAEAIGEGGMGSVWLAHQSEPVKRKVAVKLIKAGMDSRQVVVRFEAERQALAMMDHPNIAKILDGGLHDNRPYFVMELVKGIPITEYCDRQKLTPQQRLELFVPVCQAIQHAHQKGIIHRDIKPSNVLVAMYDDKPVPKVIDFGVAKATGGALTDHTFDTGYGSIIGTPQYMSPEQATFNNLDIDTRSDVYSLGVLLYELLAGSPPFASDELKKRGLLEILRVVREEEPPKPSTKLSTNAALPSLSANRGTEPKKLTGLLRNELDWIVMKALEKDRTRRYDTANGFAADIRRFLANEPVVARPPSRAYKLQKSWQRNKLAFVAVAAVVASLLFGIGVSLWQANRAEQEARRAVAALEELRDTAPAFVEQARALTAKEQFTEAIDKLDYAAKLRPEEAEYLVLKANLLQCQFHFAEAARVYQTALDLRPSDKAKVNLELCDELQTATRAADGKLSRESLGRLLAVMQQDQRTAAELMPVSRLLGGEKKLLLAYWLERLKALPLSAEKPLEKRLTVLEDGQLSLDLSRTSVTDLTTLTGAPLANLNLSDAKELVSLEALRGMKLKQLSTAGTKVADLSPLEKMQSLRKLDLKATPVSDLTALAGIPLKEIVLTGCPVRDISPLRGAPLEELSIMETRVTSLAPLLGMPLKYLDMGLVPVTDFTPLQGLPLEVCNLPGCQLTDLNILRGCPLRELMLWNCASARNYAVLNEIKTLELLILPTTFRQLPGPEIAAIEALRSHPKLKQLGAENTLGLDHTTTRSTESFWKEYDTLRNYTKLITERTGIAPKRVELKPDGTLDVDFNGTSLSSLAFVEGLPISELWLFNTPVSDLSPLKGLRLRKLHLFNTQVTDLTPLVGMPLEELVLIGLNISDISALQDMPLIVLKLNACNNLQNISVLKNCQTLRGLVLPPEAKDYAFLKNLPNLKWLGWQEDENNGWKPNQTSVEFWQDDEQLQYVKRLESSGFKPKKILGGWSFEKQAISDLSVLKGQPIRSLHIGGTLVTDLKPLNEMPLTTLWAYSTRINDLSPLKGLKLVHLNLNATDISDISVLDKMPLQILHLSGCMKLEDISPLKDVKTLVELTLPTSAKNIEVLRGLPKLKRISFTEDPKNYFRPDMTTDEFWAIYDKKNQKPLTVADLPELPTAFVPIADAAKQQGKLVTVQFTVLGTGMSRDNKWYFLNTHEDYRDPNNLTIAIQDPSAEQLIRLGLPAKHTEMMNRKIIARGKVGQFSGRPQIVISNEDWIWFVEKK